MNPTIFLNHTPTLRGKANKLPASKSISNRALIINALAGKGSNLENLSEANDTQLMLRQVISKEDVIDIEDAGTTMRFLTAYFSVTGQHKTITGTARMQERPIGILGEALNTLGAKIEYAKNPGYPPIILKGFDGQKTNSLTIRGDVSSQFISAIMMIAPILEEGLTIMLTGKIGSRPYIEMTLALMRHFGASCSFTENKITIKPKGYHPAKLFVESDWSGASYWFAFVALAKEAEITLPHLFEKSWQGDHVIQEIMIKLGVITTRIDDASLKLTKGKNESSISWDFTHCPDLAQTVAVVCAAKGITGHFTGLESLRIKETDRIAALQNELRKIGADLIENTSTSWTLVPSPSLPSDVQIETYKDHRMAMAFAPLSALMNVTIINPAVVRKSYPYYWEDVAAVGIATQFH